MIGPDAIPTWMAQGLCASIDPELWFPVKGGSSKAAKAVCRRCPVRTQCLDDALGQEINPAGIWGATSEQERRRIRAQRRDAA